MKAQSVSGFSSARTQELPSSDSLPKVGAPYKPKDTISSVAQDLEHQKMTNSIEEFFVDIGEVLASFGKSAWEFLLKICACFAGDKTSTSKVAKEDKDNKPNAVKKTATVDKTPVVNEKIQRKEAIAHYEAILVAVNEEYKDLSSNLENVEMISDAIAQNASREAILDLITNSEEIAQEQKEQMSHQLLDDSERFKKNLAEACSQLRNFFHVKSLGLFLDNPASPTQLLAVFNKLPEDVRDALVMRYRPGKDRLLQVLATAEGAKTLKLLCEKVPILQM